MDRSSRVARVIAALPGGEPIRPPSLQTGETRTASRLELFFDLAFVLVIAELASVLRKDLNPHGLLVFAGLFAAVWWCWASATLYANRFDHDDVAYRLYKLVSMLAVIGMAAAATDAAGSRSALFAGCYVMLRLLLMSQYARVLRHVPQARQGIRLYLAGAGAGALLWTLSLAVPAPARYWLWAAGLLAEAVVPVLATAAPGHLPLHLEHLPERFALFVVLVLGESVASIAHSLRDADWTRAAVCVAIASFAVAAGMWWSYFDLAGSGAKRLLREAGGSRPSIAHDIYLYGQLPLALALAGVGAAIQNAILESTRGAVSTDTRAVLAGGIALYLAVISVTNTGMARGWRNGWWAPLGVAVVAAGDALVEIPAVLFVGALALLLAAVVVIGLIQEQRGHIQIDPL
jgi:low temperature requirement protein LtrA